MKNLIIILSLFALSLTAQINYSPTFSEDNYCFSGDGSTTYINTGQLITGGVAIELDIVFKANNVTGLHTLYSCGGQSAAAKGFLLYTNGTTLRMNIANGSNVQIINLGIIAIGIEYTLNVTWDGLVGTNNITSTLNGVTTINSSAYQWVGASITNLFIGMYGSVVGVFSGYIYNCEYDIITTSTYLPLSEGYSNKAYDVSGNNNHGTIYGSNYWTTCTDNDYNGNNGYTKVVYGANTVLVPYLLNGTQQYTTVAPVLNASERHKHYPNTRWGRTTSITKSAWTEIANSSYAWTMGLGAYITENDYVKCVGAGTAYNESNQAYGTWLFSGYKLDASNLVFGFVADDITGDNDVYKILIGSDESIILIKKVGGSPTVLFNTGSGYIAASTLYEYKITRSLAGLFQILIRGGAFTNWTQINGDVTDNTLTTSAFFVLSAAVDDRIKNVKYKSTINTSNNYILKQ